MLTFHAKTHLQGSAKRSKIDHNEEIKNAAIELLLNCRLAFKHVGNTLADADKLLHLLRTGSSVEAESAANKLHGNKALRYHALYLDEAIDIWTQQRVAAARENGSIKGFSFCSDESPPSMHRFMGFRFQVTYLYWLNFFPVEQWEKPEYDTQPPFERERHLTDLRHCAGKGGTDTLACIEIQMATKGFYRMEAVSGTGDGGGENEGTHGVHALLEATNDAYVKRRCCGHFAWRISANVESDLELSKVQAINNYLTDGMTWSRCKSIACQPASSGGLALMKEGSREWKQVFDKDPPKMMDQRPECTYSFLKWLIHRQAILAQLCERDLTQRTLSEPWAKATLDTLKNKTECAFRFISCIFMQKSLYLYYFAKSKEYIAEHTNFKDIIEKAATIIWDIRVDKYVMEILQISQQDLDDQGWNANTQITWMEMCLYSCDGISPSEVPDLLPQYEQAHFKIATSMSTYVRQVAANMETSYRAAGILSTNPVAAQLAAKTYMQHLKDHKFRDDSHKFDKQVFDNATLMEQLEHFGSRDVPVLVWRDNGKYKDLFYFLAMRYVAQPDSVLPCEGVHAQWQWIALQRRNISLKLLNALLKLWSYIRWNKGFPPMDELLPIIQNVRRGLALRCQQIRSDACAAGDTTLGVENSLYAKRFNLNYSDLTLLKASLTAAVGVPNTVKTAWEVYIRRVMATNCFYRLTLLTGDLYFLVGSSKSFAYRDAPATGEAQGRTLAICFFQKLEESMNGVLVEPVDEHASSLKLQLLTLADICRACGDHRAVPDSYTARDLEIELEQDFFKHDVLKYDALQTSGDFDKQFHFTLSNGQFAEDLYFETTARSDLKKMCLARALQRREGFSNQDRELLWNSQDKQAILAAYDAPPPAVGAANPGMALLAKAVAAPAVKAAAKVAAKAVAVPPAKAPPAKAPAKAAPKKAGAHAIAKGVATYRNFSN